MTFYRTASGLSNLNLFHGVELIVFVEGGQRWSLQDVLKGMHTASCSDVKFWHELFSFFLPDLKCEFRAIGSKSTLRSIAALVLAHSVSHVIVCMDRDHDDCRGGLLAGANVLHTYGYSWENDVWLATTVASIFGFHCNAPSRLKLGLQEIYDRFAEFYRFVRRAVLCDLALVSERLGMLNRPDYERVVSRIASGPPVLHRDRLKHLIRRARGERGPRRISTKRIPKHPSVQSDCHGHLVGDFAYSLLCHCLKKYCDMGDLQRTAADANAISHFRLNLNGHPILHAHYRDQFRAVSP